MEDEKNTESINVEDEFSDYMESWENATNLMRPAIPAGQNINLDWNALVNDMFRNVPAPIIQDDIFDDEVMNSRERLNAALRDAFRGDPKFLEKLLAIEDAKTIENILNKIMGSSLVTRAQPNFLLAKAALDSLLTEQRNNYLEEKMQGFDKKLDLIYNMLYYAPGELGYQESKTRFTENLDNKGKLIAKINLVLETLPEEKLLDILVSLT